MSDDEGIRAELRAEERDNYRGTAPVYYVMRGEQLVGCVFYDAESEQWRYGQSESESTELTDVTPEHVVDVALDRMAEDLADPP